MRDVSALLGRVRGFESSRFAVGRCEQFIRCLGPGTAVQDAETPHRVPADCALAADHPAVASCGALASPNGTTSRWSMDAWPGTSAPLSCAIGSHGLAWHAGVLYRRSRHGACHPARCSDAQNDPVHAVDRPPGLRIGRLGPIDQAVPQSPTHRPLTTSARIPSPTARPATPGPPVVDWPRSRCVRRGWPGPQRASAPRSGQDQRRLSAGRDRRVGRNDTIHGGFSDVGKHIICGGSGADKSTASGATTACSGARATTR